MRVIYLDNAATTRPHPAAIDAATQAMTATWGNPSSLHGVGLSAQLAVDNARKTVAKALGAKPQNVLFTSGGTEANNLAVHAAITALKRRGNHIVCSGYEHASVHEKIHSLEKDGFAVTFVPADKQSGEIDPAKLAAALTDKTILVAVMLVNNEVGGVNDIQKIVKLTRQKAPLARVHCDAVAAFGKVPFSAVKLGVDTLTVSAHKIHGLKGCGALYVRDKLNLPPLSVGGEQQGGKRPGTENTPGILAFGAAVEETFRDLDATTAHVQKLKAHLLAQIAPLSFVHRNGENDFPYVVNLSVDGLRSEILLHFLEAQDIFVSSGSACGQGKLSHVLGSMGFSQERADTALRVSFSGDNTAEDIDALVREITNAKNTLCTR